MDKLPQITTRTWQEYDLGADCLLDKFKLDEAAEEQSSLMEKWMNLLYQAKKIFSKAERALRLVESTLYIEALQGAMSGIIKDKKPTDAAIKAWIHTHHKYVKALEDRDAAEEDFMFLERNARTSLEHRKAMIIVEKDLWICGYYSRPSVSSTGKAQADEDMREQTKQKLTDSLAKRNRRNAEEL